MSAMRTTQQGLFGDLHPPLARSSDPPTSHHAAAEIEPCLKGAKQAMFRAFSDGPKTDMEAALWCVQESGKHMSETYRKRAHELRSLGVIRLVCERRCTVTGSIASVWEVVTNG